MRWSSIGFGAGDDDKEEEPDIVVTLEDDNDWRKIWP